MERTSTILLELMVFSLAIFSVLGQEENSTDADSMDSRDLAYPDPDRTPFDEYDLDPVVSLGSRSCSDIFWRSFLPLLVPLLTYNSLTGDGSC